MNERISQTEKHHHRFEERRIEERGTAIDFAVVKPPAGAEEIKGGQYVVLVGGFSEGKEAYQSEVFGLADSGRNVLFTNPLRGVKPTEVEKRIFDGLKVPEVMQRKAAELLAVCRKITEETGRTRFDFVGHSQGAEVAAVAAAAQKGIAEHLVLVAPAGLHGEDSVGALMGRLDPSIKRERDRAKLLFFGEEKREAAARQASEPDASSTAGLDTTKAIGENTDLVENEEARVQHVEEAIKRQEQSSQMFPLRFWPYLLWRLFREAPAIVHTDLVPVLEHIKKETTGDATNTDTEVILLTANSDDAFSEKRILEHMRRSKSKSEGESGLEPNLVDLGLVDRWASYAYEAAGHHAIMLSLPGVLKQILNETPIRQDSAPHADQSIA